ncbi:Hypothetical protein PHPALM_15104 [Phytophthora palmivora]|uniref:Uncharacterized protein n=1 Tax=Phytophthora palmivora TaxID=4796 RepID=A0A2P4XT03_9STRA|nr:Hypothetical protein PHPALM_15104 [Phytophthora palmivora]
MPTPVSTPGSTLSNETTEPTKAYWRTKVVTPTTVLEGSAILATDGSMPVEYGSDSEEGPVMEDEVPSSSEKKESQTSAGSCGPGEDDSDVSSPKRQRSEIEAVPSTSEAPAALRAEPTVRDTWMQSARVIADRVGNSLPPHPIPLFVCSGIVDAPSLELEENILQ